jgi:hypothetical protein
MLTTVMPTLLSDDHKEKVFAGILDYMESLTRSFPDNAKIAASAAAVINNLGVSRTFSKDIVRTQTHSHADCRKGS